MCHALQTLDSLLTIAQARPIPEPYHRVAHELARRGYGQIAIRQAVAELEAGASVSEVWWIDEGDRAGVVEALGADR